jgi:hypothetical protein
MHRRSARLGRNTECRTATPLKGMKMDGKPNTGTLDLELAAVLPPHLAPASHREHRLISPLFHEGAQSLRATPPGLVQNMRPVHCSILLHCFRTGLSGRFCHSKCAQSRVERVAEKLAGADRKDVPQRLKPDVFSTIYGTTKVVPFPGLKSGAGTDQAVACYKYGAETVETPAARLKSCPDTRQRPPKRFFAEYHTLRVIKCRNSNCGPGQPGPHAHQLRSRYGGQHQLSKINVPNGPEADRCATVENDAHPTP